MHAQQLKSMSVHLFYCFAPQEPMRIIFRQLESFGRQDLSARVRSRLSVRQTDHLFPLPPLPQTSNLFPQPIALSPPQTPTAIGCGIPISNFFLIWLISSFIHILQSKMRL